MAMTLQPTPEAKAAAWAELTSSEQTPNWRLRALLQGFHHQSQLALTQLYVSRYFQAAAKVWAERDSTQAREFIVLGYPRFHISSTAVSLADEWLSQAAHPAPLRRLIAEGRDVVVRSLTARRFDGARLG
jgi:aminopeptidase N